MIMGLPIGMWIFKAIPERPLKIALGIFMVVIGIKGLYNRENKSNKNKEIDIENYIGKGTGVESIAINENNINQTNKLKLIFENITIFCGGIVHGAFTCGGPFVVVYATKNIKDKSSFRATLCALWATLNGIMLGIDMYSGNVSLEILKISTITMMFVFIAIVASNIVHKK